MAKKEIKNILKSKTFLVALIQGILGIVIVFATEIPELGGLAIAKSVLDVVLRLLTGEPVEIRLK